MQPSDASNGHVGLDVRGTAGTTAVAEGAPAPGLGAFQHWAFEVETPFRPVAELMEASGTGVAPTSEREAEVLDAAALFEEEAASVDPDQRLDSAETLEGFSPPEFEAGVAHGEDEGSAEPEEALDTAEDLMELEAFGFDVAGQEGEDEFDASPFALGLVEPMPVSTDFTPGSRASTGPRVKLDHWQQRSVCDPTTGVCTPAAVLTKMTPSAMNPGFIDEATDTIKVGTSATSLQSRLAKLIVDKYGSNVTAAARKAGRGTAGDRLRVAVVDLSGAKLAAPEFAGWGSTMPMQGVSTTKVAILYALHQLLLDVFRECVNGKHTKRDTLIAALETGWRAAGLTTMPAVSHLVELTEQPPKPVAIRLSAAADAEVSATYAGNDNNAASRLMLRLTLPYIASVLWQSGLHHAARGGLWLTSSFGCDPTVAKAANQKEHVLVDCTKNGKRVKGRYVWRHDPRAGSSTSRQNVTALSLATMFTLLAQGRLGGSKRSTAISTTLTTTCTFFWTAKAAAQLTGASRPPAKCGVATIGGARFVHDVALVERGTKRFVVVALTRDLSDATLFERLIVDLDGLV